MLNQYKTWEGSSLHASIEPLSKRDITAIVKSQGRLDERVLADLAKDLGKLLVACLPGVSHGGVGIVQAWELGVVPVTPFACLPAGCF